MKCAVNDGKEAVPIDNIYRYCYEDYQVYNMLKRLYPEDSMSWKDRGLSVNSSVSMY
jgi:hypothetical protein